MVTSLELALIRWSVVHRQWHETANDMPCLGAFLAGWFLRELCEAGPAPDVKRFRDSFRRGWQEAGDQIEIMSRPAYDPLAIVRDAVLNARGPLEDMGLSNEQTNAVLAVLDDARGEEGPLLPIPEAGSSGKRGPDLADSEKKDMSNPDQPSANDPDALSERTCQLTHEERMQLHNLHANRARYWEDCVFANRKLASQPEKHVGNFVGSPGEPCEGLPQNEENRLKRADVYQRCADKENERARYFL